MKRTGIFYYIFTGLIGVLLLSTSCTSKTPTDEEPLASSKGLSISALTSTAGGNYAPKHVVAIWIEDNSGKFVKSLTVNAESRKSYLTKWHIASNGITTDAKTGATRTVHGLVTGVWNGTDRNGKMVADGIYKVCLELTDKNSSGNSSSFSFTKGLNPESLSPMNNPSFSSISIKWFPL